MTLVPVVLWCPVCRVSALSYSRADRGLSHPPGESCPGTPPGVEPESFGANPDLFRPVIVVHLATEGDPPFLLCRDTLYRVVPAEAFPGAPRVSCPACMAIAARTAEARARVAHVRHVGSSEPPISVNVVNESPGWLRSDWALLMAEEARKRQGPGVRP
jgi:hypothetical protein